MNGQEIIESFGSLEAYDEWCDKIRQDIAEKEALAAEEFEDIEADRVINEMKSFPADL